MRIKSSTEVIQELVDSNLGNSKDGRRVSVEMLNFIGGMMSATESILQNPELRVGTAPFTTSGTHRAGFDAMFKLYRDLKA